MITRKKAALIFSVLIVCISGCYNDKEALLYPSSVDCNNVAQRGPKFTLVRQICDLRCVDCHKAGSTSPDLTKDCNIVTGWQKISDRCNTSNAAQRMPQGGQLPANELQQLNDWVSAGHQFNQ